MNTNTPSQPVVQSPEIIQAAPAEVPPVSPSSRDHIVTKKWFIFILVIISLAVIAGVFMLTRSQNQSTTTTQAVPTINPLKNHDYPATMVLSPPSSEVKVGESVNLTVLVSAEGKSLDGADSILTYDPKLFDASIVSTNGFPSYLKKKIDTVKGRITITGVTLEPKPSPQSSELTFAQISFKAKKIGVGTVDIVFKKGDKSLSTIIENGTSYSLLGSVGNATITVTN